MKSTIFVCLCLILAACQTPSGKPASAPSSPAQPQQWVVSEDLQVTQIHADVWVHTSWHVLSGDRRFPSNGLLVRDGDALVLVDTAWGVAPTAQLLDWVDRRLQLPVKYAVATHFHDDRVGGWPALAARGIPLRLTPQTLALARAENNPVPDTAALPVLAAGEALRLGPLELFHPGHAHSADNLVVWLPGSRLLFGGCAVKSRSTPAIGNVADADLASWQRAIAHLQTRYPQVDRIVPGHQDSGGAELLEHTLALLRAQPA